MTKSPRGYRDKAAARRPRKRPPSLMGWAHRGYRLLPKGAGWRADNLLWRMFPTLPKLFHWSDVEDRIGLMRFIDNLYEGNEELTLEAEKRQRVTGIEYPDPNEIQKLGLVQINIRRLLDCLRLTDTFNVPLGCKVGFVTDGNTLVATDFIALLASEFPEHFQHIDPQANWTHAGRPKLETLGLNPDTITSGHHAYGERAVAEPLSPSIPAPGGAPPPSEEGSAVAPLERTKRRLDCGDYIDWITEVEQGDQRFFVRRLYRETQLLYVATAWSMRGPWTVQHRDTSALLALGVAI